MTIAASVSTWSRPAVSATSLPKFRAHGRVGGGQVLEHGPGVVPAAVVDVDDAGLLHAQAVERGAQARVQQRQGGLLVEGGDDDGEGSV
jgi:hypothetical protein